MEDEYVRKDYHDATMREIKALMERNLAKQEAMNSELNARLETRYTEIQGEIKNIHTRIDGVIDTFSVAINDLKDRIDDIKTSQANGFARWGIAIAVFVGIMQVAVAWFMK